MKKLNILLHLDENCILNEDNLLDKNGTIQIYNLQNDSSVTLYCGSYKEDKKEQEEIDNDYRKQAKELVNKMDAYLKKIQHYLILMIGNLFLKFLHHLMTFML